MADRPHPAADERQTLRYRVPDYQDPVVVLTALADADYDAGLDEVHGSFYVVVTCPRDRERDREEIRAAIARRADQTSLDGPRFTRQVVFDDET